MCGRVGVEVPVSGAWRLRGHADGGQRLVERIPVAKGATRWSLGGHHGLLLLEGWAGTQNAGPGCTKLSRPSLHVACPGVVAHGRLGALAVTTAIAAHTAPTFAVVLGVAVAGAAGAGGVLGGVGSTGWIVGSAVAGTMSGGERLIGIGLGIVLLTEFLKDEKQSGAHECMGWVLGGDHGFEVAIVRIEPSEQVEDLTGLRDMMAD